MKKISLVSFLILISLGVSSQITISRDDMPNVGDTIRLSNALITNVFDPSQTGADYTWDYSSLVPQTQVVEGYVSTQSTPFLYQIIFNQNVANLASPIIDIPFLPDFPITDAYIFYKESNASYTRAGYAATIAGVPVPMKFDVAESLYTFPLTVNSPSDSSTSVFSFQFPGVGYFSIERKRVNSVDGWGSLTTPFGTFPTLRVKSLVYEYDSIYIDSVQVGVPISRLYTEYKWLANGKGIPVLTITQEGPLVSAQYIDSVRNLTPMSVTLGEDQTICKGSAVTLTAEVSGGTAPYTYLWNTLDTTSFIEVQPDETTTYSVLVTDQLNNTTFGSVTVNVKDFTAITLGPDTLLCAGFSIVFDAGVLPDEVHWFVNGTETGSNPQFELDSTGIGLNNALVRLEYSIEGCQGSDEVVVGFQLCGGIADNDFLPLTVSPNPVGRELNIRNSGFTEKASIQLCSSGGNTIQIKAMKANEFDLQIDVSKMAPGIYLLMITENEKKGVAKIVIR
ncbi:MAG: T9SS type A sorting domain-containing protein [Bacteroidales bacterium]|nr:T9SS type A sorting domain-containing protein [Bacteroidales bacterium]